MTNNSQNDNTHYEKEEISLKDLLIKIGEWWRYLLSKWIIILVFGFLGGALGLLYAYYKKPVYTATTTFVLEEEKTSGGLGDLAGLASMAGVNLGGSGGGIFQGDNIFELYKSRKMIVQTLLTKTEFEGDSELLVDKYIRSNQLKENWSEKPALLKLQFKPDSLDEGMPFLKSNRLRDSVMSTIVADINKNYLSVVKPDKKLSIIKVDVKSKDEFFAKTFNEAIVRNVNDFYLRTKTKKSIENIRIMQHKTDSVRAVMNGAIYSGVAIADATPNLNPTRQVQRIVPAQRAQFSAETNKAILSSLVQNLEMSKVSLMKETPLLEVLDRPIYPLFKEKLGKLKGLIIGGFLAILFTIFCLILIRVYKLLFV